MRPRTLVWLLASAIALAATAAPAHALDGSPARRGFSPDLAFLQYGVTDSDTTAFVLGAAWDLPWRKNYDFGALSVYLEASFGRWTTDAGQGGSAWVTQIGVTPVFRLEPASWRDAWFAEFGIGANVILPVYRSRTREFSTEFNFGDHVAVGRQFGKRRRHELALRIQHFSNAGIDDPNPGVDFLQLRYSRRY